MAKLFDISLKKDNVQLNIAERGAPLIAKTTDAVLLQLFLNLFDNSLYWLHSKQGGKRQIEVLLDGDENILIFSDNGPGVKAEDAAYIFEPFYSGRERKGEDSGCTSPSNFLIDTITPSSWPTPNGTDSRTERTLSCRL